MRTEPNDCIAIARDQPEPWLRGLVPPCGPDRTETRPQSGPARLASTVKEAEETLGVSQITVYRLVARGLLKPSLALRKKVFAKSEI